MSRVEWPAAVWVFFKASFVVLLLLQRRILSVLSREPPPWDPSADCGLVSPSPHISVAACTIDTGNTFHKDARTPRHLCMFMSFPRLCHLHNSKVEVEHAVDMLVLMLPPAGGDDLQGERRVSPGR